MAAITLSPFSQIESELTQAAQDPRLDFETVKKCMKEAEPIFEAIAVRTSDFSSAVISIKQPIVSIKQQVDGLDKIKTLLRLEQRYQRDISDSLQRHFKEKLKLYNDFNPIIKINRDVKLVNILIEEVQFGLEEMQLGLEVWESSVIKDFKALVPKIVQYGVSILKLKKGVESLIRMHSNHLDTLNGVLEDAAIWKLRLLNVGSILFSEREDYFKRRNSIPENDSEQDRIEKMIVSESDGIFSMAFAYHKLSKNSRLISLVEIQEEINRQKVILANLKNQLEWS